MPTRLLGRSVGVPVAVALAAVCLGSAAAAPGAQVPPSFGAQAAAITLDVVVVDEKGQPVRGLAKDDFSVLEDGRPQTVVGFEAREVGEKTTEAAGAPPAAPRIGEANDEPAARPERVLALLVDDLGISAPVMGQVRSALAGWIERRARPHDEITIMTASGDVWWSDTVERGRDELLTVLNRLRGRMLSPSSGDAMNGWEACQIDEQRSADALLDWNDTARSRPSEELRGPGNVKLLGASVLERVTQRWLDARQECDPTMPRGVETCRSRVQARAQQLHEAWLGRAQVILGSLARLSKSLAGASGRKSILFLSEEFFRDTSLELPLRGAVDASQRANTAIYFVDARGLAGSSLNVAENRNAGRPQDIGMISMEQGFLATAGGAALAEDTGGVAITNSNDLAAGLERMALDSSAYYLLGYQPEELPDGTWHSLEVKVARRGVKVRARKRYLAMKPEETARLAAAEADRESRTEKEEAKAKDGATFVSKRPLSPALLAGNARDGLPLRLASYVQDTNDQGLARVQVVLEIDHGRVQIDRSLPPWKATLDLTIMAASLSRAPLVPIDERLQLSLEPGQVGSGYWLVPRELWLPPGVSQVRALVRDAATGAAGLVTERVVVPNVDQPYLSTPMISDRTLPPLRLGEPPRLVPTARRVFSRRGPLFCQLEVFVFGGRNLPGSARLSASHSLRRVGGEIVSTSEETPIETDSRHAIRRITLPIDKLEPGGYELTVSVTDALAQRTLRARSTFVVERDAAADLAKPTPAH